MRTLTSRGFTLVELMVGAAVTSIMMVAVVAAFTAVQASYQAEAQSKGAVESARTATSFLERNLRLVGFGVDPRFAIDVATPAGGLAKNNHAGGNFVTDDLAVRFRDPAYLRRGALSGTTLTLEGGTTFGVALEVGQPLLLGCATGGVIHAVRIASAAVAAGATSATVQAYGAPFPASTDACLGQTGTSAPFIMRLKEYRFRVIDVSGHPWLVAFRNLADDVTSSTDWDPVAADVENFQVSYVLNRPPGTSACCASTAAPDASGNQDWILGNAPNDEGWDATATPPTYATAYDNAARFTRTPANVRAIQVTVVARSPRAEPTRRKAFGREALQDWTPGSTAADGFFRATHTTTVRTPNMAGRSSFVPSLRAPTETVDLNVWGG